MWRFLVSKNNKEYSARQEKLVADILGCSVVKGSGARPCNPGDVKGEKWLCECKTHTEPNQPIFFSYEVWEKIVKEAMFAHRSPLLVTDDGSQIAEKTWCIFPPAAVNADLIYKLPLKVMKNKNITFKHFEMIADYETNQSNLGENVVYDIHWGRYFVYMCPIKSLLKICEDDI